MADLRRSNWYVAEIVLRFQTEGEATALVHVNSILISAEGDEQAYNKSRLLGERGDRKYINTEGRLVQVSFVGLRNLFYVYDGLEDGSELIFEEFPDLTDDKVNALTRPKERLAIFAAESVVNR